MERNDRQPMTRAITLSMRKTRSDTDPEEKTPRGLITTLIVFAELRAEAYTSGGVIWDNKSQFEWLQHQNLRVWNRKASFALSL